VQTNQTSVNIAINFARKYFTPIAALVSFFPIYFWTYSYFLPREVRILLDPGFYTGVAFELIMVCAACGLIARISAYQFTPLLKLFLPISDQKSKYAWLRFVKSGVNRAGSYLTESPRMTFIVFLIAVTGYFIGIIGLIFLSIYAMVLLSAFGSTEKVKLISRGDLEVAAIYDVSIAIKTLSSIALKDLVGRHLNFLSMAVLALPLSLGYGRFVSLVGNDNVALQVNSDVVMSKLIASTDAGLLFMASDDAKVLRLMTWRPTDYFLLMPSGKVVCFGKRNTSCSS